MFDTYYTYQVRINSQLTKSDQIDNRPSTVSELGMTMRLRCGVII